MPNHQRSISSPIDSSLDDETKSLQIKQERLEHSSSIAGQDVNSTSSKSSKRSRTEFADADTNTEGVHGEYIIKTFVNIPSICTFLYKIG